MPLLISLSPSRGEGRVRGWEAPQSCFDTLTLPLLRNGSLPLPQCGRGALAGEAA